MKRLFLFLSVILFYCAAIAQTDCPDDFVVNNDPGQCGAIINYVGPSSPEMEPIDGFTSLGINNGKAFYLSNAVLTCENAFTDALAKGGFVATVRNATENELIKNSVINATGDPNITVLIGINDAAAEGSWVWHSGEPVTYTNWDPGEPNGGPGENYTQMLFTGLWNDVPGYYEYRYVLEKNASGGGATQTAGLPSGSLFPVGVTTNEFSNGCSFTVTVVDNESPEITCPGDMVTFTDPGACGARVEFEVSASDNCYATSTGFAGYFAPANWTLETNGGSGSVDASGAPAQVVITSSNSDQGKVIDTQYKITITTAGVIKFDWDFFTFDYAGARWDPFGYSVNGNFVQLTSDSELIMTESGSHSVAVNVGDIFAFVARTIDDGYGNSSTTAVNFTFTSGELIPVQTAGLPSGSLFPVGTTTNTFEVTDEAGNTNTCSFDVTVNKRPTQLTYTGDTEGIYSDGITISASLMDISDPGNPVPVEGKLIIFNFEQESLSEWTDALGIATRASSATPDECDDLTISTMFEGDCTYLGDEDSEDFELLPEDAGAEYTGTAIAATKNSFTNDFTVMLRGIILDDDDDSTGDISKANARFIVNGVPVCSFMPVIRLNEENQTVGVIEYEWAGLLKNNPSLYDVQIEINSCFYEGLTITYPLTVYRNMGDFITGGGHMIMTESAAGLYPPGPDSKLNFGFIVNYNKKGNRLQGKMNIIYREFEGEQLVAVYQIESNNITSLNPDWKEKKAEFVYRANLTDVTDPEYPIEIAGNLALHVTMTDMGEPGDQDQIAFSLYKKNNNALWFSSNWSGTKTLEQLIDEGNLVVHSGTVQFKGDLDEVPKGNKSATISSNSLRVYPNPFSDRLYFEFTREESCNALIEIFDAAGRKLTVLHKQPAEAGQTYRLEYHPVQPVSGMLFYRMIFGNEVITGKVIYNK
jgi:hypothetical protein